MSVSVEIDTFNNGLGTATPPTMFHPCVANRDGLRSVCTPQVWCGPSSCTLTGVPSPTKSRSIPIETDRAAAAPLTAVFIRFVFIDNLEPPIFLWLLLAFLDSPSSGVSSSRSLIPSESPRFVPRKVWKTGTRMSRILQIRAEIGSEACCGEPRDQHVGRERYLFGARTRRCFRSAGHRATDHHGISFNSP